MEWAGSSHLFCFSLHSGQTTCLFPASFPPSSSTLLVSLCFLFLCLYKQFLLLKFIPQSSHWNLVIPSQLGGGTESAESALEESEAIVPWEVGCVDAGAGAGGPVLGDGSEWETLFSEGFACGQACGSLFCAGLVGSGRVKGWGFFALDKRSAEDLGTFRGFPDDNWDPFLHEGAAHESLGEEGVFGGGENVSFEDIGELGIEEEPVETWAVLTGKSSAREGEEHSLADACSSVALGIDPLEDDALGFRDSLSFFLVLLDVSRRRQEEWSDSVRTLSRQSWCRST